jgi:hypothetical protein
MDYQTYRYYEPGERVWLVMRGGRQRTAATVVAEPRGRLFQGDGVYLRFDHEPNTAPERWEKSWVEPFSSLELLAEV